MKVIAVYSTKGGVGKTTAAVNLAWEASRLSRVLLWDLDPQGAATYILQVKPKLKGGVDSLVTAKKIDSGVVRSTQFDRLDVLPADDSYRALDLVLDGAKNSTLRISKVLEQVGADYDVVILDCPPGAGLVAENVLAAADVVVLPLVPSPLSLRSLDQVIAMVATSLKPAPVVAFLSMVDRRKSAHRVAAETLPAERSEVSSIVVPSTVVIERMGSERAPLATYAPKTEAALAYRDLWMRVFSASHVKPGKHKH